MTRRGFLVGLLAVLPVPMPVRARDREFVAAPVVHEHEAVKDHRFFDLKFSSDDDDDNSAGSPHVGIVTEKDSALGNWLARHDGNRIALSLRGGGSRTQDGN